MPNSAQDFGFLVGYLLYSIVSMYVQQTNNMIPRKKVTSIVVKYAAAGDGDRSEVEQGHSSIHPSIPRLSNSS